MIGFLFRPVVARVAALASVVVLGLFAFGGELRFGDMSAREWLLFLCFPIGVAAGLVIGAVRRPALGGAIALGSVAAFYLVHYAGRSAWPRGPYFLILAAPAVLLVVAGATGRRARRGAEHTRTTDRP